MGSFHSNHASQVDVQALLIFQEIEIRSSEDTFEVTLVTMSKQQIFLCGQKAQFIFKTDPHILCMTKLGGLIVELE